MTEQPNPAVVSGWCIHCKHHLDTFEGLKACPNCGTTDIPCRDLDDVTVKINWYELQVLVIWAERWAHEKLGGAGIVYSIAERLRRQEPNRAELTLAGQVEDLKKDYPNLSTNIPGVEP